MKVAPPRSLMIRRTFIPENPLSPAFESRLNRQGQRRQNWCHRTCNKTTSPIVYYEFARCVRPERSHFQHRPVQTTKQTMCNMDSSSRLGGSILVQSKVSVKSVTVQKWIDASHSGTWLVLQPKFKLQLGHGAQQNWSQIDYIICDVYASLSQHGMSRHCRFY